jgi:hypothetical protein
MDNATITLAINQERNQVEINLSVNPKFTVTNTKVTKHVVTRLMSIANFMSALLGLFIKLKFQHINAVSTFK